MQSLMRYYRDEVQWRDGSGNLRQGWPAAPHLFIAPDGLWIGTPFTTRGVHAGAWNGWSWGIEVVGDYNTKPWDVATRTIVIEVVQSVFAWANLNAASLDTLRGHRECGSSKTCPGSAIDMDLVRGWVNERLRHGIQSYRVKSPDGFAAVRIAPNRLAPQANNGTARLVNGTHVEVDQFVGQWARIAPTNTVFAGNYVHHSLLERA